MFQQTATFPEANATRTSVTATYNSTVMESSLPKAQNKTATIQAIAPSKITNATITFSTVDVLKTSVEASQNGTAMDSSSSFVKNKTAILQATVSSKIIKVSSTFAADHVLRTNVEVSQNSTVIGTSSSVVQNKTSMIRIIHLSTSSKTLAFFFGVDTTRTSLEVSHNRSTIRSSLSLVQSKTPSKQTLAFSEIINATRRSVDVSHNRTTMRSSLSLVQSKTPTKQTSVFSERIIKATRTSVENSHISTIKVSSVPLIQNKVTANRMSSSYRAYKTTVINSEGYVTRTSVGVSLNRTFKSSLPNVPLTTSLIHSISSSTDVSLGFKIPRTSTVNLSSSHVIHNGTLRMYMRPSYKVSEITAPRTSVSVSRNFKTTVSTLFMLQNKTSMVQVIAFSTISAGESSKGLFSSSKARVSSSFFENHSNRLPLTEYMTPTFRSTLQSVSERISSPNITVASITHLPTEVASRYSSKFKSNTFSATKGSTSNIIMNPSKGSVTVKTTLPYGSVSKTKSLRRSTVSKDSHLKSTKPTVLSLPFFAPTTNSVINPTVQKTSQVVSSPSKDKANDAIFTPHRTISLLSAAAKSSLSSTTMLPSIDTTKHQQQKQRSTVSALKRTGEHTSTAHYNYSNVRGSSSDIFSIVNRKSRPQSSQIVSTFVTKDIIPSSTLNTDFTQIPLLTPVSGHSSRILTSNFSHVMQSLTSLKSSTRKEFLGYITFTTTTPRITLVSILTEENLSNRNSQTSPSVQQKTESITARLSAAVSTYQFPSISEKRSISTASQTIRSLMSSQKTIHTTDLLSTQTTLTGVIASRSTKYIVGLPSITIASQRQRTLASFSTFTQDSIFTFPSSYPLSSDKVPTSTLAISPVDYYKMTMITQVSVKDLHSRLSETLAILFGSVTTKRFTFPSRPTSTLNSILTQSSVESRALFSTDRLPSTALHQASLTLSTKQDLLGPTTFTRTTPRVTLLSSRTEENRSNRNVQTPKSVQQKTKSITSRLSTVASTYLSSSTRYISSAFQTIRSLMSSQKILRSTSSKSTQPTLSSAIASRSTKYILEFSSITTASQRQSTLVSFSNFPQDSRFTSPSSYQLTTSRLVSDIVPTSTYAISPVDKMTMVTPVSAKSSYLSETSALPFGSVSTKSTINSTQSQPFVESRAISSTDRRPSTALYQASLTSSTRQTHLGSITFATTTPCLTLVSTLTKESLSKRNSQTLPSVQQRTESITSRLSTVVSTYKSSSTSEERSISTASQMIRSLLPSSQTTLRSISLKSTQPILTGVIASRSTEYITGLSSIITSQRERTLVSFSIFSQDPRFISPSYYPLTTFTSSSDISTSFTTFTPSPASTVLVSVQTGPPPENPKQFEGSMVLQMPWNPQYQTTYTPEYQALATLVTRELSKAFQNLEGFLSVQVLRFWKSSVGVDFVVFVRRSVQINESTIEKTLIEANNTGALGLPMTSLQVTERKDTTTPSLSTQAVSKSLKQWEIILIVAGILVFLLLLIICILAVGEFLFLLTFTIIIS